ncbi:MAG TPA: response regulator transcription factor [Roseiflexaceae bacterium]|nr:response regulator transcription factor [Roseiflexaceae bacterium]
MTGEPGIRVMLVDDHPLALSGLRNFLSGFADLELAGEACSGREAVQRYPEVWPDVVLMDLLMPDMDGIAAIQAIRVLDHQARIVALTSLYDADHVQKVLQAGAVGYLFKDVTAFELAQAIRLASGGCVVLSPSALQALNHTPQVTGEDGVLLSEREQEVLTLLAQGYSNQEIAVLLHLSRPTVKYHLANLFSKFGVSRRTEAVAEAYRRGLISLSR